MEGTRTRERRSAPSDCETSPVHCVLKNNELQPTEENNSELTETHGGTFKSDSVLSDALGGVLWGFSEIVAELHHGLHLAVCHPLHSQNNNSVSDCIPY